MDDGLLLSLLEVVLPGRRDSTAARSELAATLRRVADKLDSLAHTERQQRQCEPDAGGALQPRPQEAGSRGPCSEVLPSASGGDQEGQANCGGLKEGGQAAAGQRLTKKQRKGKGDRQSRERNKRQLFCMLNPMVSCLLTSYRAPARETRPQGVPVRPLCSASCCLGSFVHRMGLSWLCFCRRFGQHHRGAQLLQLNPESLVQRWLNRSSCRAGRRCPFCLCRRGCGAFSLRMARVMRLPGTVTKCFPGLPSPRRTCSVPWRQRVSSRRRQIVRP